MGIGELEILMVPYVLECAPLDTNRKLNVASRKLSDIKIDLEYKIDLD